LKRKIITTSDGSKTIYLPEWNEHYHSKHGAIQEAYHVFIKSGLFHFFEVSAPKKDLSILEIGFGTGLNTIITLIEAQKLNLNIDYTGVEAYPVSSDEVLQLNYIEELSASEFGAIFQKIHKIEWEEFQEITRGFNLIKRQQFFLDIEDKNQYNLIYFDAFGAREEGGVLVTYSAKGSVRRAMQAVGFAVERLPGPPGKREMLRASKIT